MSERIIKEEYIEYMHVWCENMMRELDHIRNNDDYTEAERLEIEEYVIYLRNIHLTYKIINPPTWYKISRIFYISMNEYKKTIIK